MKLKIKDLIFDSKAFENVDQSAIQELATSMAAQGQLQPIRVAQDNKVYFGVRRVLAARSLGWEEIEAEIVPVADDDSVLEVRIHENVKRAQLPWYRICELEAELHTLREKQHGVARRGRGNKGGWGIRQTAEELGKAIGTVSEDLQLALAVKANPRLCNIKDRTTALRLVKIAAAQEVAANEALIEAPTNIKDQVFCGSAADILENLEANQFACCITDPPWIKFSDAKFRKDSETLPVFKQVYRVLKPNSVLFMFVGIDDWIYYRKELENIGFDVTQIPYIWFKEKQGVTYGVRPWEMNRDFEFILLAAKGKPVINRSITPSGVYICPPVHPHKLVHPNEKPLELINSIVKDFTFEGSLILDPFGGSGVLGFAARRNKRHYTIIERDQEFYESILSRLHDEKGL